MNREDRFYDLMEENTDDAGIQYEIGLCYLNGDGTEKDTAEAEKWLTRAANQGHEQAKALLESGNHDTPEKPAETDILELCMKAEEGDKDAQYAAARYFMAHGMAQTEADRYLKAAADQGNGQACDELGESLLQQSINCANQNDRFEKEKQAVRYFKNALDCGIPHAAERLADCYLNARGTLQNDPEQAEAYFVKAAELYAQQGKPMALIELAERYAVGNGVPESYGKALSYVKRAQNAGAANAMEQFSSDVENYRAAQQREAEEKERQRQEEIQRQMAEHADIQAKFDSVTYKLEEWEKKLSDLRQSESKSHQTERDYRKTVTLNPNDLGVAPGILQLIILCLGALWTFLCAICFHVPTIAFDNVDAPAIILLILGIICFGLVIIHRQDTSFGRYVIEAVYLLLTLLYWKQLIVQTQYVAAVGEQYAENGLKITLIWAGVVVLAMVINLLQILYRKHTIHQSADIIDNLHEEHRSLSEQIFDVQHEIKKLEAERDNLLNKL